MRAHKPETLEDEHLSFKMILTLKHPNVFYHTGPQPLSFQAHTSAPGIAVMIPPDATWRPCMQMITNL